MLHERSIEITQMPVRLSAQLALALRKEAARRRVSADELLQMMVEVAIGDKLFNAILDA